MPIKSFTTLIVTTCPILGLFYSYNNTSVSNFWTMSMWFALWPTNHAHQWLNPQIYHLFFHLMCIENPSKFVATIAHWNNILLILISNISSLLEDELNSSLLEEEPQLKLEGDIPCVEVKMEKIIIINLEIVLSYIIPLKNICIDITSYPLHSLHLNSTLLK